MNIRTIFAFANDNIPFMQRPKNSMNIQYAMNNYHITCKLHSWENSEYSMYIIRHNKLARYTSPLLVTATCIYCMPILGQFLSTPTATQALYTDVSLMISNMYLATSLLEIWVALSSKNCRPFSALTVFPEMMNMSKYLHVNSNNIMKWPPEIFKVKAWTDYLLTHWGIWVIIEHITWIAPPYLCLAGSLDQVVWPLWSWCLGSLCLDSLPFHPYCLVNYQ